MSEQAPGRNRLIEIELEVLAEGREWMRRRVEEKLQQEAERDGRVFPPQRQESQASAHRVDGPKDRGRRD